MITTRVYVGNNSGGPIDYRAPIADVPGQAYTLPTMAPGSRMRVGIRRRDDATGLEERNVDATLELILDATGRDASDVPNPPASVTAAADGTDGIIISWRYMGGIKSDPESFAVHVTAGPEVDFAVPYATVGHRAGVADYRFRAGPLAAGSYTVSVRSVRGFATADGPIVPATVSGALPVNVAGLTGVVV
jgi:hypothetical protein